MRTSGRSACAVSLILTTVLTLSACSDGGSSGDRSPAKTPQALVDRLAIAPSDLRSGERSRPAPGGNRVDEQRTIDECGFTSTLGGTRMAQATQTILNSAGDQVAVAEASRYAPGKAVEALNELRGAFIACDEVVAPADDGTNTTSDAFPVVEDKLGGLASDHVAATITTVHADGSTTKQTYIVQRRADVLVGSIAPSEARAIALAKTAAKRLANATATDVGA